ncbi:hypothetical protein [Methylobacterium marchantiae]|uniref:Uncharacterized protein n=1 Tax=Methylobacterium marchantiae TaxID=600331 RepID=A0ABW3WZY7_9HYPH
MTIDSLRCRLDRLEARCWPAGYCGAIRILTEDDADSERQVAALRAAGQRASGVMVIDRRIIDPGQRSTL